MSQREYLYSHEDVVGAVQLALEAGADPEAVVALVRTIVDDGEPEIPPVNPANTKAVKLFVEATRTIGGRIEVPA